MKRLLLCSLLLAPLAGLTTVAGGCYAEDTAAYPGDDDGGTDLVEVQPGVEVIADYDEPIFFADDYYWVNRGGLWYRSGWYRGGWERAEPSVTVRGIVHPEGYAHYRPSGWAAHERVRGNYAAHQQYHAAHAAGSVHVRAAVHGGGGHRR
jgi:hypothetical protein|nr:hypothetical protein [Kofleriaceae bacterium]